MRVGVGHAEGLCIGARDARELGVVVAAAPVLIYVVDAHGPLGGLVEEAGLQLAREAEPEVGRVALDQRREVVVAGDRARGLGAQVAAEVVGGAEGEDTARILDEIPLDAHLPLERGDGVVVAADHREIGAVADRRRGGHGVVAVDVAPVVLHGHAQREVLEELPAHAQLDLRHVALALVDIAHAAHVAPHGVGGVESVLALDAVARGAVGGEAEAQAQTLGQGQLESHVVEVESVVGRGAVDPVQALGVVVVLPFETEVEEKGLLRGHAVGGRIEQVDRPAAAHGHAHAAHRTHRERSGGVELADAVEGVGREGVDAARLGQRRRGEQHGRREEEFDEGFLHVEYASKIRSSPTRTRLQSANIVFLILFAKYFASPPVKITHTSPHCPLTRSM